MLISLLALLAILPAGGYLLLLALAALRGPGQPAWSRREPQMRFAIAIPAHDEETVIAATVGRLCALNYPRLLFDVHVVADHCSDDTAALARRAGAAVHERNDGPRTGKGAALAWLFQRILHEAYDAVVVFDSDTQVDPLFLRHMEARLAQGARVIQGQHVIRNPDAGWFPALTWAMFMIDNRFQNLGRSNLGWSAKHMGDSICFQADILRRMGWGEGLTEDYQLRQRLLLAGIKISYEPAAKGYGQAPRTWAQARAQRARWLGGTHQASRQLAGRLLAEGLRRRDLAILDGALQARLPSYSTLTLICAAMLLGQIIVNGVAGPVIPDWLLSAWAGVFGLLFVYPLAGLALEGAPLKAYLAILTGPLFVVWRTALAVTARRDPRAAVWVRTAHEEIQ
jgi:cellulose synthase/poly-beta-1,6-N-acetylglucosamine synthase-like glycosyltransferase